MGRSKLAKSNTNSIAHDLNETNVQTIFNKCLANENTKTQSKAILFPMLFGYKLEDEILVTFDRDALEKNEKTINYLYGQLKEIHDGNNMPSTKPLSIDVFTTTYTGDEWTKDKGPLLKFLYLGCNGCTLLIRPFSKDIDATRINRPIKPTLSPKDPNFFAWWEEHKGEWE